MSDFDPDAFLDQGAAPFDPDAHLDTATAEAPPEKTHYSLNGTINSTVGKFALHQLTGLAASAAAGGRAMYDLATGKTVAQADKRAKQLIHDYTYTPPEDDVASGLSRAYGSNANPLNWPSAIYRKVGDQINAHTDSTVAGPVTESLLNFGTALLPILGSKIKLPKIPESSGWGRATEAAAPAEAAAPVEAAASQGEALTASGASRAAPFEVSDEGAPSAAAAVEEPEPLVREHAPGAVDTAEQARRAAVLKRVGLDRVRQSAITGDAKSAATDYQTSKLDNAAGNEMRGVIDNERAALESHADRIVSSTGGSQGLDQHQLMSRGETILSPLEGLKRHFDTATRELYKVADERAAGAPIETPSLQALISGDQADFLGTTEGEALLRGVKARMKSLGLADEEGAMQPATVTQTERLKQYLNNQWSPRTSRLIGSIKDAIDDDVTKAAGADIYQSARQMRRLRAVTLDDPDGIARILDASGPDKINRSVPTEKVADTVASMPVAQMDHIVTTLKNLPEELKPQGTAALNEIRAHFADKVLAAGRSTKSMWNTKGVDSFLAANNARMKLIFTPEELNAFRDLSDAGHILAKDQSYPGAAVQEHNLVRSGAMAAIRSGATGVGGAVGGPVGAMVGGAVGEKLAGKLSEKAALKAAQKRIVDLTH